MEGYDVVFVRLTGAEPTTGDYEIFADGFAGRVAADWSATTATYRPSGVAQGPDGSRAIVTDKTGRIWRVGDPAAMAA